MNKDQFEYTTETGYVLAGIKFVKTSEWEGMEKWQDEAGRTLIVMPNRLGGFAGAFGSTFGGAKANKLTVTAGTPTLLAQLEKAKNPAPASAEQSALQQIREAGYNEHPTSVWMQKVAAHALEPQKFAHPGEQPKAVS